jgi:hypothetical protein
MISAETAITKTRRGLTLSAILRWALTIAAASALVAEPMFDRTGISGMSVLMLVGAVWLVLSFRSVRGSRVAADSSSLIAAGDYDRAEENITEAMNAFSIFRTVKLMSLHHLALLRHAQNRWKESALLCQALLAQRPSAIRGLDRSSRLILAEALLELGDLRGVYDNLVRLYERRLSLREALNLLAIQMDYLAQIGAWDQIMHNLPAQVELAELLPAAASARTQAIFALAAKKLHRDDWHTWLRRRVELLTDVEQLRNERPYLSEVWADNGPSDQVH